MGYDTSLLTKAIWKPIPTKTIYSSCTRKNPNRSTHQYGGVLTIHTNSTPSNNFYGPIKIVLYAKTGYIVIYNVNRTNHYTMATAGPDILWM